MKAAKKQLAEWDAELNQLHERNGDLGLKVQMLEQELKEVRRDREEELAAALAEPSKVILGKQKEELAQLRLQLAVAHANREEIEIQLSDLRQKSVTASELPEPADLLNQLKARRKKSKADLADVEAILEILQP